MMSTKKIALVAPEIYLVCATLYYWSLTSTLFNPIAIGLLTVLMYQILRPSLTLGLVIATIFLLLNLYMVLALISELSEFTAANSDSLQLLIFGSLFLGINLIAGTLMCWKYVRRKIALENNVSEIS